MILEKYSTLWAEDFTKMVSEIDKGLNGLVYEIEHVGSTSVPDLDSKPIIGSGKIGILSQWQSGH